MKTKIYVCRVYSKLLNESEIEICFERNNTMYMGPLFWNKKDWIDERITRYLKTVEIEDDPNNAEGNDHAVVGAYLALCNEYGLKTYESTPKTMLHWMCMNGFTDHLHETWNM